MCSFVKHTHGRLVDTPTRSQPPLPSPRPAASSLPVPADPAPGARRSLLL